MSEVTIGETAGSVWKALAEQGPVSIEELATRVGEDKDLVSMAIGWLARENKLNFEQQGGEVVLSLRGHEAAKVAPRRAISSRR